MRRFALNQANLVRHMPIENLVRKADAHATTGLVNNQKSQYLCVRSDRNRVARIVAELALAKKAAIVEEMYYEQEKTG